MLELSLSNLLKNKSDIIHTHHQLDVVDFPISLPANGGRSDTTLKLETARTINGVSFDGSKDITITATPTSHNHDGSDITSPVQDAIRAFNIPTNDVGGNIWIE